MPSEPRNLHLQIQISSIEWDISTGLASLTTKQTRAIKFLVIIQHVSKVLAIVALI